MIVWLDSNLTQFCLCYYLQKEIDADFFAIIDTTNKTRSFFENQNELQPNVLLYFLIHNDLNN